MIESVSILRDECYVYAIPDKHHLLIKRLPPYLCDWEGPFAISSSLSIRQSRRTGLVHSSDVVGTITQATYLSSNDLR